MQNIFKKKFEILQFHRKNNNKLKTLYTNEQYYTYQLIIIIKIVDNDIINRYFNRFEIKKKKPFGNEL